ncbi:MAG: hypothetical protein RBR40_14740 [Tenuifilaceae bacterium]|nr:hypothetical protein [Tenuifilaceae bacterium]
MAKIVYADTENYRNEKQVIIFIKCWYSELSELGSLITKFLTLFSKVIYLEGIF